MCLVYIVDDDEELSESLAWLLESVGIRSERYHDARTFLASYDPSRPACLVLDVRMPELSGFGVQELLNEAGAPLTVVFVSAHGDIRMSVRALQNGALDFLEKPYDPQHLLDVVQTAQRTAGERFARAARHGELRARLDTLSVRERQVLTLSVEGVSNKQIAGRLGISAKTVDVHRARIREKTGADSIATLVRDILRLEAR
ncbi:response regulator transcription factor [Streptomyces fuscichromogenes]|uniref:DNA-binding response regulator n=1 Tax=Streptomyces fuscichromogenes TaxID=1324013 RepID=A0A917XLT6_9ACTN|nr:response regulator [Streptomyces fuscichromogenes]GGN39379.1 DNA-binding response regulator [Streptomyces fuscichromogenes]